MVADLVRALLATKMRVVTEDFGIVTPYRKQVRLIRDVLRSRKLGAVRVGTVDDYQGQEAKVVIISTVITASSAFRNSSSRLGFMSDPKRFNVAISRAQALLIVVGNPFAIAEEPVWSNIFHYCLQHNSYRGCRLPGENLIPCNANMQGLEASCVPKCLCLTMGVGCSWVLIVHGLVRLLC